MNINQKSNKIEFVYVFRKTGAFEGLKYDGGKERRKF